MSVNTIDLEPLKRFMQKVARMAALKQTDIRLTLAEATEISATLAAYLMQQGTGQGGSPSGIDGGGFSR